jgi:BolA protein
MQLKTKIEKILQEKFQPEYLDVINESHKHAGHGDFDGRGETHFRIIISDKSVPGNSRLEKHRSINGELKNAAIDIHSVSIGLI